MTQLCASVVAVAAMIGRSPRWVRRMIEAGQLEAWKAAPGVKQSEWNVQLESLAKLARDGRSRSRRVS